MKVKVLDAAKKSFGWSLIWGVLAGSVSALIFGVDISTSLVIGVGAFLLTMLIGIVAIGSAIILGPYKGDEK